MELDDFLETNNRIENSILITDIRITKAKLKISDIPIKGMPPIINGYIFWKN